MSIKWDGGSLIMQGKELSFQPCLAVAERIRALGRTEDVMFSPDQTRLAIAGYHSNSILIIRIGVVSENGGMSVQSDGCVELHCPEFVRPHGLSWIDDSTLLVANRNGDVIVVTVPAPSSEGKTVEVAPLLLLSEGSDSIIKSPGSVAVTRLSDQYFDVLVCNNYRNYVSRHIIHRQNGFKVISGLRLFEHGLTVPDSLAVSSDGEFVAVSNHYGQRIDLFRNDAGSAPQSPPAVSLGVPHFPHGVRFAMGDRLVLVADAGAPFVHVYARAGLSWAAASGPDASIRVMDDASFQRGHQNPEEGGPKGLDILADGSLLVVSCEEVPIAFFDFRATRDHLVAPDTAGQRGFRSSEARMLETILAAMKGQHDQIGALQAELMKLKPTPKQSLDQRIRRFLKGAADKALASAGKS